MPGPHYPSREKPPLPDSPSLHKPELPPHPPHSGLDLAAAKAARERGDIQAAMKALAQTASPESGPARDQLSTE